MPLPAQSYLAWKVCITVLHAFAASWTFLRLWIRHRGRRLWWDDYLAAFALLLDVACAVMFWFRFSKRDPTLENSASVIHLSWFHSLFYFTIVWFSRISLALCLARIFPPGTRTRRWLLLLTTAFAGAYLTTCVLTGVLCTTLSDWTRLIFDSKGCKVGHSGFYISGLIAICFDFVADFLLVACPLALLWRIKLPSVERTLVLVAFSASILTSLAAIVFCIFWFGGLNLGPDRPILLAGVAHIQAAVSLIVCNVVVVILFLWRFCIVRRRTSSTPPSTHIDRDTFMLDRCTEPSALTVPERAATRTPSIRRSNNDLPHARRESRPLRHDPFGFNLDLTVAPRGQLTLTSTFESHVVRVGVEHFVNVFKIPPHLLPSGGDTPNDNSNDDDNAQPAASGPSSNPSHDDNDNAQPPVSGPSSSPS